MSNQDKIVVGITGGIGSGKTTVAKLFEDKGIPVYYADEAAKLLMKNKLSLKQKIIKLIGEKAYDNGNLDRSYVASIVFNNPALLEAINNLVHPEVSKDFEIWKNNQKSTIVMKEAAILVETEGYKNVSELIVVNAPKTKRLARVMMRDKAPKQDVLKRMSHQISDDERNKFATIFINNIQKETLEMQVDLILEKLKKKYKTN